ncbi:hypothetical protein [Sphingomicrobium astaxanthinifaciens]|uniref:hypothetical protein n=1 Tax=Sphingomicrobium astaxanthinifaciens TaxID=1227949 RepID=UPI001FCB6981|nr:hypothetical protein [Sphingomicrobium astaxanthinifaciens]MCJ7421753.1 hypothetical protein [Sphingomicrobium astaxanthinifaciens]
MSPRTRPTLVAAAFAAVLPAPLAAAPPAPPVAAAAPAPALVVRLTADAPAVERPLLVAQRLARDPRVARATFDNEDGALLALVLVFPDRADFSRWMNGGRPALLDGLGEGARIRSITLTDPALVRRAGLDPRGLPAGNVSVTYANSGRTVEGDADIDAVTVLCTDGALCKPSN